MNVQSFSSALGGLASWKLTAPVPGKTHLFLKLRNQNPLSGVYLIFPFLLTECLATPRSQSVFPPTSTWSDKDDYTLEHTLPR